MKKILYIPVFLFFTFSVFAYEYKSNLRITLDVSDEFFIISGIDVDTYIIQLEKRYPGKYNTTELRKAFDRFEGLGEEVEKFYYIQAIGNDPTDNIVLLSPNIPYQPINDINKHCGNLERLLLKINNVKMHDCGFSNLPKKGKATFYWTGDGIREGTYNIVYSFFLRNTNYTFTATCHYDYCDTLNEEIVSMLNSIR